MPIVTVQTGLPSEEYQKFKRETERLQLTEYKLAQEILMVHLNQPKKAEKERFLAIALRFIIDDLSDKGT